MIMKIVVVIVRIVVVIVVINQEIEIDRRDQIDQKNVNFAHKKVIILLIVLKGQNREKKDPKKREIEVNQRKLDVVSHVVKLNTS